MFQKLSWFVFLLVIAAVTGIWLPNAYTTIECTNADKMCKTYHQNSVLKTKKLVNSVDVSGGRGLSYHVLGVGKDNVKHLSCSQYQQTVTRRNGKKEIKTTYLLGPINKPNPLPINSLHEYGSQTACEVDRVAIETYLSSNNDEPFVYVISSSWFRYAWYLVSVLFVMLAVLVLFKGEVVPEEEEKKQLDQKSAERAQQLQASARNFIQRISAADTKGAESIREAERRHDEHKIDIEKDQ